VEARDTLIEQAEENVLTAEELGFASFLIDTKGECTDPNCWRIESLVEISTHLPGDFRRG